MTNGTGTLVEYSYDVLGRRFLLRQGFEGQETKIKHYVYSGENILTETITEGNVVTKKEYINGLGTDNLIAVDQLEPNLTIQEKGELNFCNERVLPYTSEFVQYGYTSITNRCNSLGGSGSILVTNRYYFHKDNLGSIVGITDNSGTTVTEYSYDSYGKVTLSGVDIGNTRLFTGREYDEETGLYFNRARYYDPSLGRFISRDPIGINDDINLYAYVGNSPVNATDPSGMNGKPIVEQAFNIWDTFEQLKALKDALVQSWGKSLFRGGGVVAGVSAPICASTVSVTGECGMVAISDTPIVLPFCYISGVSAGTSCGITGLGVGVAMIGNQMQSSNGGGNGGVNKRTESNVYTNKDYDEAARKLGLEKVTGANPSNGRPIYRDKKGNYYSPEKNPGHNTDFGWKKGTLDKSGNFNRKETLDSNLNYIKK